MFWIRLVMNICIFVPQWPVSTIYYFLETSVYAGLQHLAKMDAHTSDRSHIGAWSSSPQESACNQCKWKVCNNQWSTIQMAFWPSTWNIKSLNILLFFNMFKLTWNFSHLYCISFFSIRCLPLNSIWNVLNISRYGIVHCRQAELALTTLLAEWCDFILIENDSYIKFLYR